MMYVRERRKVRSLTKTIDIKIQRKMVINVIYIEISNINA